MPRSAKTNKHDRKRKQREIGAARTERSRQRRLDNAAKRAEILAINPGMKIKIINQVAYDAEGAEIKIENGKVTKWLPAKPQMIEPEVVEVKTLQSKRDELGIIEAEKGKAIDAQIEKERLGVFNPFRWKKK